MSESDFADDPDGGTYDIQQTSPLSSFQIDTYPQFPGGAAVLASEVRSDRVTVDGALEGTALVDGTTSFSYELEFRVDEAHLAYFYGSHAGCCSTSLMLERIDATGAALEVFFDVSASELTGSFRFVESLVSSALYRLTAYGWATQDYGDSDFNLTMAFTPEPSTALLLGMGLVVIGLRRRQKRT